LMKWDCWSCWRRDPLKIRGAVGAWSNGLTGAWDGDWFWFGWIGCLPSVAESAGLHGGDGFGVLHEGVPDEGAAKIFCHEDADAEVDAEDVGVVPVEVGVECVAEAVAAPCVLAEVFSQGAEDADAVVREEG
jgi:hypothetical protein